ncbi:MAG: hypothetical protein ACK48N_02360 [Planctomyces sp.]
MAARSSSSTGLVVTVVVLVITTITFFVLTLVMYNQRNTERQTLASLRTETTDIVRDSERNQPATRELIEEARGSRKSLVGHLSDLSRSFGEKVTGTGTGRLSNLVSNINTILKENDNATSLASAISRRRTERDAARRAAKEADDARLAAESTMKELRDRVDAMSASTAAALGKATDEVNQFGANANTFRTQIESATSDMKAQIDRIRAEANDERARLMDQKKKLEDENRILQDKLSELSRGRGNQGLRPADEAALVDGLIAGLDSIDPSLVYLNLGRNQKAFVGMTFEVYTSAAAIRPSSTGEYSAGKATIEVTRVEENGSTARVIRPRRGHGIVKGDVIANPVYDPNKVYTFVVFGNFDPNLTGTSTPEGAGEIKAMISAWGGRLSDQLTGDVDFLILGSRPVLPPQPPTDAPIGQIQDFLRLQQIQREYDRLVTQAAATNVPILNQNRLYTLTGRAGN